MPPAMVSGVGPGAISGLGLPGHHAPAVGLESPFELLSACHDRVRRTLDLLSRLQLHVTQHGCDDDARSAARDVLRYFDVAAPLHHQDEELHVFPLLLAQADTAMHALVRKLQSEHLKMEEAWQLARDVLLQIDDQSMQEDAILGPAQVNSLRQFAALYGQHMDDEEQLVYPAAQAGLSEAAQKVMGQEMGVRRGVSPQRSTS